MGKPLGDLAYFTHEVDGRRCGGWFRVEGGFVEVYARGRTELEPLGSATAEARARAILEEIIRSLAPG